jgi:hypothetical protein
LLVATKQEDIGRTVTQCAASVSSTPSEWLSAGQLSKLFNKKMGGCCDGEQVGRIPDRLLVGGLDASPEQDSHSLFNLANACSDIPKMVLMESDRRKKPRNMATRNDTLMMNMGVQEEDTMVGPVTRQPIQKKKKNPSLQIRWRRSGIRGPWLRWPAKLRAVKFRKIRYIKSHYTIVSQFISIRHGMVSR